MARLTMRRIRPGEVPQGAGTAVQEDPDRPVFHGNGPNDYVCAECGNVLAVAMDPDYMDFKVRVKCARCRAVNVADTDEAADRERWAKRRAAERG